MMSKNFLITSCPSAYFKWTAMIDYNVNISAVSPMILISDISGRIIKEFQLTDLQNQIVITVDDYPCGIYIVQLTSNDQIIESQKLSVVK